MEVDTIEMTKISVIIPIKNRADLIGQTLDSILGQTLQPCEIILVDDGSTDGIVDALFSYKDKVTFIKNKGVGPGAARNTGLEIATGECIKFFDSDDLMTPTSLYEQAKALLQSNKKFITSPYIYAECIHGEWKSPEEIIMNYNSFSQTRSLQHWMIWGLFIPIPSMLFRKSFLEQIGPWPTDIVTSEDWIYLWKLAQEEPFPGHINTCAFIYRLHVYQSTGANMDNLSRDKEKFRILQQAYNHSMRSEHFSWFDRLIFKSKYYQMATVTKDEAFKKILLDAAGTGQWAIGLYYRLKMKIGRKLTASNWQPMHGISRSENLLNDFLKSIK
ncbi:glycosyltransferase family 2 protein [Cytophaga aurantiaca]|uniref:glycosyltransferase family 2 protein n=1 Tax=Cytophaga aurantiaca TaxID=29530 RepID=UPI000363FC93|nr:glycosyltransferase family 2 protein [Cytophaga aurantiaca]